MGGLIPVFSAAQDVSPVVPTAAPSETSTASAAVETQNSDVRFQSTYVWQRHPAFAARYSGPNSLSAEREPRSYTLTATAFIGVRAWQGGEVYFNPEVVSSQSLSGLHGLGGLTNGENQKGGGPNPTLYRARLFVRQSWGLGGGAEQLESAPNQLAGQADRNRLVLTAGNVSLIDIFDNNAYSHDPRMQFLNWTIMTHGAFDYAADTRGYTWGVALEYFRDDWVLRLGRFEQPIESNGFQLDSRIFRHYGDQIEIERRHEIAGEPGKLKWLVFRNRTRMGGFRDAIDAWRTAGGTGVPSVAEVRRERSKLGWGINLEQALSPDAGFFLRASWNDGRSETYAFTEVERSFSSGFSIKGTGWRRPDDVIGLGFVENGLSAAHRDYLANGGLGAFIGDGVPPPGASYRYAPERVVEAYYSFNVVKGAWLSLDYQQARNPAYNADRGPVKIGSLRLHAEF